MRSMMPSYKLIVLPQYQQPLGFDQLAINRFNKFTKRSWLIIFEMPLKSGRQFISMATHNLRRREEFTISIIHPAVGTHPRKERNITGKTTNNVVIILEYRWLPIFFFPVRIGELNFNDWRFMCLIVPSIWQHNSWND